jgi:putative ABC transport system permease protein
MIQIIVKLMPAFQNAPVAVIKLNPLVLVFTLALAVATGVLFGLAPAIQASRPDLQDGLKEGSRGGTSTGANRLRQTLVIGEVALAMMLLVGAVLMLRSVANMTQIDLGFRPKDLLTFNVMLPGARYREPEKILAFYRDLTERLKRLPGVESVSAATNVPLQRPLMLMPVDRDDTPYRDMAERPDASLISADAAYFETLGATLKQGRFFLPTDNESAPPVVIINEAFARSIYKNESAVGKRLILNMPSLGRQQFGPDMRAEIVGVVKDLKLNNPSEPVPPVLYAPFAQNSWSPAATIAIRAVNPNGLIQVVRQTVQEIDKEQPIDRIALMETTFDNFFAEPRFRIRLLSAFAVVALVLAVIGIYGVISFFMTQRRREIGLRIALGATPSEVMRNALSQGMILAGIGIVLGAAGAAALSQSLQSLFVGVSSSDPLLLTFAALLLGIVALAACFLPAFRASRIDPVHVLRQE